MLSFIKYFVNKIDFYIRAQIRNHSQNITHPFYPPEPSKMFKDPNNNNRLSIKKDAVGKLLKTFDEKFKIVIFTQNDEILGKGAFGKCYLGILKNQQTSIIFSDESSQKVFDPKQIDLADEKIKHNIVVVKQIRKNKKDFTQEDIYKREIQNLSLATKISRNQKNLVRCYPFTFSSDTNYYMVMEYCQGKSLDRLINKRLKSTSWFNYFQFLKIFSDITNGYYPLNKVKVLHEDLKPENIFIKGKNFKIGDFGLSFAMDKQNLFGRGGSQSYNGIQKYKDQINVSHKSDIYAMGIIFYRLFYGIHPYYQRLQWQQYRQNQIEKISNLIMNKKNQNRIKLTRWQEIQIFIKFYESRKIKERNTMVKKPSSIKQFGQFEKTIDEMFRNKIPQLLRKMINKNIEERLSFTQLYKFLKENKILQIISQCEQYSQARQNKLDFFKDLSQQNYDNIQLPFQFSQIGQKICFEEQSDIHKEQIQIRNTFIKTQSQYKERTVSLSKRYPKVFELKQKIQKINEISRFLMEVYYELNSLSVEKYLKRDSQNQQGNSKDLQNQIEHYEQKKIQLQFVVQKYLLSFLNFIKQRVQKQIQTLDEVSLQLFYKENVDLMFQIIDKNKEFLQGELFLTEKQTSGFQENQRDLQRVICHQFLQNIGLDSKNLLLAYFGVTIIAIKQKISGLIQDQNCQKSVKSKKYLQNQNQENNWIHKMKEQWNLFLKQQKSVAKLNSMCKHLRKFVEEELKKRNIVFFVFFD